MSSHPQHFDIALIGGGLANSLIALATLSRQPLARVALVERDAQLGGNHTWSFHMGDVSEVARTFVEPLIAHRWPGYSVRFSQFERRLNEEYATVTSERLARVVREAFATGPASKLWLGRHAIAFESHAVSLDNGDCITADLVVDGRGPERWRPDARCRYQKFVGLEFLLERPGPWREPLLMDASVSQADGLHFVYVLPFSPERVLIEDTYFSDSRELDDTLLAGRVFEYAAAHGLRIEAIVRRESGVLPLPLAVPTPKLGLGPLKSGFAGGWFHPTTGYSFPLAVALAELISGLPADAVFGPDLARLLASRASQQRYFCFLNRLLYGAFPPHRRINVLERFYGLPAETVRRFYCLQTTPGDRARILCGRPPRGLSLSHALASQV